MNKLDSFPTREHTTYNCDVRSTRFLDLVHKWTLLGFVKIIVIVNSKWIRNCRRMNGIDEFEGIVGIRCTRITLPWNLPFKIIDSRKLVMIFLMINSVTLHSLEEFKFWSKMIGQPIFTHKLCGGVRGKSSEFKNSTEKLTALSGSKIVSIDLNDI